MDQKLLDALNNISIALEQLSESLDKSKSPVKSDVGNSLQSGDFSKQLVEINEGIKSIKEDTKKILDNQETIIKLQKQQTSGESKVFEEAGGGKTKQMIKDGVAVIGLIAGAILAIGLAFKLIGDVNFVSVLAIAFALPLMAEAFARISKVKGIDADKIIGATVALVAMSFAIMVSSRILAGVVPVGLFQLITVVFIAAAFGAAAVGLGFLLNALGKIDPAVAIQGSFLLPIVLIATSIAIVASSFILQAVVPIGLFQALTAILIAAAFGVMAHGIGKLIESFKGIDPATAAIAASTIPIVLIALSLAIVGASWYFQAIIPIGLFQALTAILIAATFVVLSYAVKPLLKGIKNVKNEDIEKGTIVILALTAAVTLASWILMGMAPVEISSIFKFLLLSASISLSVVVLALAVKALNKIGKVNDFINGGKSILVLAATIMLSSLILSLGSYEKFPDLMWGLSAGLSILGFGLLSFSMSKLGSPGSFIKGGISIAVIATVIMLTSRILSLGDYSAYPPIMWSIGTVISIGLFGIAAVLLGTFLLNPTFYMGLAVIVIIAATIVAVSYILGAGSYEKYPTASWSLGVGLALGFFGLTAILLGTQVFNPLFYLGLGMVAVVALAIVGLSYIFEKGSYKVYPPSSWVVPTMLILGGFSVMAVLLGIIAPIVILGVATALIIAGAIFAIDMIFQMGSYKVYPPNEWVNSTMLLIGKFALMSVALALVFPFIALGSISIGLIVGVIYLIDKVFTKGNYLKYPNQMWQIGVTLTINRFANLIKDIRKNVGFGDLLFGSIKILGLAKSIVEIDKMFSQGKFEKFPKKDWVDGSIYSLEQMSKLVGKQSIFGAIVGAIGDFFGVGGKSAVIKLAQGIVQLDQVFSKGKFKNYPTKGWIDGVIYSLDRFRNYTIGLKKLGGFPDSYIKILSNVTGAVKSVAAVLAKGDYTKYPSKSWIDGVIYSLDRFRNYTIGLKKLGGFSDSYVKILSNVTAAVKSVDEAFAKGDYAKYPKPEWIDGTIYALQKFKDIISLLNFSGLGSGGIMGSISSFFGGKTPLEQAVSNITMLAIAFDKLGSTMNKFSNSIEGLDVEKLSLVKGLSSNMIMLSLMDPDMLEDVLTRIEEKGGVFAELIKNFEDQKKETSEKGTVKTSGGTSKSDPNIVELQKLGKKMDNMTGILSSISSVVSGDLRNYLMDNSTNERNIQVSSSDRRLKNIIRKIGTSPLGINIYEFAYKFNSHQIYVGVIAQELIGTEFESALVNDKNGYYAVDYSKIDVKFSKLNKLE